ncbi:MAG: type VI secretion system tip protein VgrG [Planctomycetaceae bacterium]|nr:type VI secretion system tip protein VgrG [Planctomycetaceae bacterium]
MAILTQDDRPIAVETILGKDKLLLMGFTGEERLSGLFSFDLRMLSEDDGIKSRDMVGTKISFHVRHQDGEPRWFNGIVNSFTYSGKGDRAHLYRAHVVPQFWLLTRGSDCRVHESEEKQTAGDIIQAMLKKLGITQFEWKATRGLRKRAYCVQYRESHFDFISRLLEEEGIYYYFVHAQGSHTIVFADTPEGTFQLKDREARLSANVAVRDSSDNLGEWSHEFDFTTGKFTTADYDFETPSKSLKSEKKSVISVEGNSGLEFYDFPGAFDSKFDGAEPTRLRIEEEECSHESATGTSECRSFSPGGVFTLAEHHTSSEVGGDWLLTAVEHHASLGGSYYSGGGASDEIYQNTFRCIPASVPFRPPRQRAKPRVMGLQSAIVTGPSGEEIYTDKYGRIKIQFHWDRLGQKNETTSMWVRVATPWAGNNWGMIHIPRIGQEVLVSFLEGDPDYPVVIGSMYNAMNMPPYGLPNNKTQSGIKSHSTKKGSDQNFNEIRFEDKKGEEEIYVHAEKDFNCVIENNETRKVGYEDKDKGDQEVDIYNDQKLKVGIGSSAGSQTVDIFKDRTVTLKTGNDTLTLEKGNMSVVLKMGNSETTLDMGSETRTLKMGNAETTLDMGNLTTTLKMGNQVTKLNLGKSTTEAMQAIELKVGPSSIKIDPSGITLSGVMIKVQGQAMTEVSGAMTKVAGSGMVQIQGGITMIN